MSVAPNIWVVPLFGANGTKEGLVKHPREWPGACANNALCTGEVDFGLWVHRTYHADLKKKASKRR